MNICAAIQTDSTIGGGRKSLFSLEELGKGNLRGETQQNGYLLYGKAGRGEELLAFAK